MTDAPLALRIARFAHRLRWDDLSAARRRKARARLAHPRACPPHGIIEVAKGDGSAVLNERALLGRAFSPSMQGIGDVLRGVHCAGVAVPDSSTNAFQLSLLS